MQTVQTGEISNILTPEASEALATYHGLSAWASGRCLGAAGFIPQWPGRALCWALVSKHTGRHMRPIIRRMRHEISMYNGHCARLEMHVRADFAQGHRLAAMLGFDVETLNAPKFFPDGGAGTVYARVR